MSKRNIIERNPVSASPHQQVKLFKALDEFFRFVEPSDLLEAQSQLMSAYLEQEVEIFDNLNDANRIYRINQQSTLMIKLYEIYRDIKEEA